MVILRLLVDKARRRQGLPSKRQLALLIEIDAARLSNYESGARRCPVSRVAQLAELAGLDVERMVGRYELEWLKQKGGDDTD